MNKIELISNYLNSLYEDPKTELNFNYDYELLIAVVMSAQTTDKQVNIASARLFEKYPTVSNLASANIDDIANLIKTIGTYKRKSVFIKTIAAEIAEIGYVPNDREFLESLPGVGRKTANVVLSTLYNVPAIAVDTHVARVSKRLGLAKEADKPEVVELKLMKKFSKDSWSKLHNQLVLFGRYHCKAQSPLCETCGLKEICNYYKKKN